MVHALVLLSGGLDSMLAVKVLQNQNIEVEGVCFESSFFGSAKAKITAENLGIKLHILNIDKEHLKIVKHPQSGYGKNMNPCIDCHALMLKIAKEKFGKYFDLIATGEVLGQRPFSQNRNSLKRVEKLTGFEVLRPLSAKVLDETEYEKKGLVNRKKLLDVSGRGREKQLLLAKKYKIKNFATPAGGCLLTDPFFSQKLRIMMSNWPKYTSDDINLLKYGRIFWLNYKKNKIMFVVGRNEEENNMLQKVAKKGDIMVELKEINGPLTLVRILNFKFKILNNNDIKIKIPEKLDLNKFKFDKEKSEEQIIEIILLLTGWYATKARGKKINFNMITI